VFVIIHHKVVTQLMGLVSLYQYAVVQLVEALRYKPGDGGFDSRWCHWNFLLT
jgi:hypothetical protein